MRAEGGGRRGWGLGGIVEFVSVTFWLKKIALLQALCALCKDFELTLLGRRISSKDLTRFFLT